MPVGKNENAVESGQLGDALGVQVSIWTLHNEYQAGLERPARKLSSAGNDDQLGPWSRHSPLPDDHSATDQR